MKQIFTPVLALAALFAAAQTQRLVMIEEFTNASCGPCASQNPAFNTLLAANPTKQISLKYQTVWPGFDPMNAHNPTEVASRVTYYNVSGVPYTRMDGVEITGSSYAGAPANLTQAKLDAAWGISSNVGVSVSHTISNDLDSIYITVNVTNATANALTTSNHVLHVGIAEEEIIFPSAPGSNGETDFYFVMRKMLPNASGTALPASIGASGNWQQTFAVALPSYIYNYGEIAVVAFVQDNGTKSVLNAGYSAKQPVPAGNFDAALTGNAPSIGLCDATFTPTFTLKNNSATAITSATISYTINGGTAVSQNWTGNLAAGATTNVAFASANLSSGLNEIEATVSAPNGGGDYNSMNNMLSYNLSSLSGPGVVAPHGTNLENATAANPPVEGILNDPDGFSFVIAKSMVNGLTTELGGFGLSTKSLFFYFWNAPAGSVATYTFDKVNLSNISNPMLYFQHAYRQYSNENDNLTIRASKDCGTTWTTLFNKSGAALQTVPPAQPNFFPAPNEWAQNYFALPGFGGEDEVIVQFIATSAFGNNLLIDNISFSTTIGVEENDNFSINFYPNPSSTETALELNLVDAADVSYEVVSATGQVVTAANLGNLSAGTHTERLNVANFSTGLYIVRMNIGGETVVRKITVKH
jgi:hypothetical protein